MLIRVGAVLSIVAALTGCSSSGETVDTPGLEPRGTVLTTVQPTRQDVTNSISLSGTVTINPVFGIVAPADGELRYVHDKPPREPAARPLWVATVWEDDEPHRVEIPKDTTMAGRLMEDHATVTAGMPIVSARHAGYGIVADIDSALAYRISGAAKSVRGQIKNGPGPFACEPLGTIAALPAGTVPAPPQPTASPQPSGPGDGPPPPDAPPGAGSDGSEPTGLRLVCTPDDKIKLINGAAVTLSLVTARVKKALVLPVEAIAGTQGRGKVDVVGPDRVRKTVDVVLGLTDGKVVQIKSGLTGDENIAIPGPNLPTAAADAQGGKGGMAG